MNAEVSHSEVVTIRLPGATAVRIDTTNRLIAIDGTSSSGESGPLSPEWLVQDLRDGAYGDFHLLRPADECNDVECASSGEHATPEDRASRRDALTPR